MSGSCSDFLDQEPQAAYTQEQVFADLDKIEPLISGLYASWRNTKKDRGGFMFSLGTDESQQGAFQVQTEAGQAGLDRYNGFLAPSNTALTQQWDSRWPVYRRCRADGVRTDGESTGSGAKKPPDGEASFIRAVLSFEISQYWGEIPVIDFDKLSELGTTRRPLSEVYEFIVADLERAIQFLPETQADKRRATKVRSPGVA